MSELAIQRVAILGAGTMGAALGAHLTNLGFSVTLLDATHTAAGEGLERVRSLLYVPERAHEVRTLSFEDGDLAIGDADWIVEAVREELATKQALYARIAPFVRPDAIISTAGGSLPLAELIESLPDLIATRFFSTHFTLPFADRRFVEVRPGPATDSTLIDRVTSFLSNAIALRVVRTENGAGSVVARYGLWCVLFAIHVAEKLRLDLEDVDMITGPYLGRPPAGVFGTADLIGLDKVRDIATNLRERTPNERVARYLALPASFVSLIARGWTGDKVGQGFYRREGREKLTLDLSTMVYRQHRDGTLPRLLTLGTETVDERVREALGARDEVGEFLREFLIPSLRYAEALRDATGMSPLDFDRVMQWGYGWEAGPFALLDHLGVGAAKYYEDGRVRNVAGGYDRIPSDPAAVSLEDSPIIERTEDYTVHDLEDGVQALAVAEGPLSPMRVQALSALLESSALGRFVWTSAGKASPGLDLEFVYQCLRAGDSASLEIYLLSLQTLGERLEQRACIAAIQGHCVGASLSLALSCPVIVAASDAEVGFDEARIGIVPTARALTLMRSLHGDSSKKLSEVAVALAEGTVASSADLARQLGFLRPTDVTEYDPERLLGTAKRLAMSVEPKARTPLTTVEGPLVGLIDRGLAERRARGGLTEHDVTVGHRIRQVLARTSDYEESLERERRETMDLGPKALTLARIRHVLETGRPIRN